MAPNLLTGVDEGDGVFSGGVGADWAAADAAEALDFADSAVENAQLAMLDAIHARAYADQLAKAAGKS